MSSTKHETDAKTNGLDNPKVAVNEKRKLVIDCDPGVDDAQALLIALGDPSVDVLAITCASGNVGLEQTCANALRVLKVCDRLDIPVYPGVAQPVLGKSPDAGFYHGKDGLGDAPHVEEYPSTDLVQKTIAPLALSELARKHNGEITLVCLAPLTNIAMALRLDPEFAQNIKNMIIMGGNVSAFGNAPNERSVTGEFNFSTDPEAAYVILHEMKCPIEIVPLETCEQSGFPWTFYKEYTDKQTRRAKFVGAITKYTAERERNNGIPHYYVCDPVCMCYVLRNEIATKKEKLKCTVELAGNYTRGQVVIDKEGFLTKFVHVNFITGLDKNELYNMFMKMTD